MPVPPTSPFCPNYLRKKSEVRPSGKFCRKGPVSSLALGVHLLLSVENQPIVYSASVSGPDPVTPAVWCFLSVLVLVFVVETFKGLAPIELPLLECSLM